MEAFVLPNLDYSDLGKVIVMYLSLFSHPFSRDHNNYVIDLLWELSGIVYENDLLYTIKVEY